MWPWSRKSQAPSRPVLSLGEVVIVEGRSGVLVPTPASKELLLSVWFGETVGEDPVVELVLPDRVYRWDGDQGPVYYH
jgi:hypothetical protein